ncbi:ArsJ-associated glyceraldehyde-3-phosphate dehydrogenase [Prochlorococcus marinus]|uniref:ArsJ-associated glyceraldehyde-3-phosphate dehydrogenase n=1 Tax=Prochlorococcus marinus TaxID=1219 RepID=UPI001ADC8049|nr:ArsJ-associated glyceraldehyde-3-phosphate dehydrogenase [Prochlorococcus marinus]MBO8204319.1 ArsJ-associated glyceraldehyde-3-phosphate dehydrogenase [Prochlorococcus marinus CUG1415]MBW3043616.1 type I glyceraldehyde-3-phosphate dehydrogenase [Prochlorococcus marinus str. MU1415]
MKIGINGFGRIGRLVFRALWDRADIEITHINEIAGDSNAAAHLLEFDSVHGRWGKDINVKEEEIIIDGKKLTYTSFKNYLDVPWGKSSVDIILECTGKNKKPDKLNPYFNSLGMKRVIVACPVKGIVAEAESLNVVYGINQSLYDPSKHKLLTAASCTTNCLAPIVKVINENFSIKHGAITTIHDVTNTQVPVDFYKSDLRRARGCMQSLIPTTTGSAKAIAEIFPELKGKLNGHAVRVPLLNASLTDAVFELNNEVNEKQVNNAFKKASETYLKGILGYEERPLVSADYLNDSRSCIIDGLSTMVVNSNLLKVYAWYDNEWGYSCRLADLTSFVIEKEKKF